MIIANPIFDVVFKRLMEDHKVAKFFLETLLEETIDEVDLMPQEFTYKDTDENKFGGISIFRVDFIATIKTGQNAFKKVLIEIQKARNAIDLMRFRNYLGEQYKKEDEVETIYGKQTLALPIVTIYLLGFTLPEIDASVVKVNREYMDLLTHEVIKKKSEFIEKLTHDCFVVQLPRIHVKLQTRLEKLLSIFEQNFFIDSKGMIKEYNYTIDDESIRGIIDILHYAGTDPKKKKEIEDEQEAWRIFELETGGLRGKLIEKDKIITELKEERDESAKALEEKNKALEESRKLIEELKRKLNEKP